jgi:hypothetical protein
MAKYARRDGVEGWRLSITSKMVEDESSGGETG